MSKQVICPRCQQIVTSMGGAGNTDIVHICNSGNPTLDNEDVFKLGKVHNWNFLGVENQLSTKAKIQGAKFNGVTRRGYKAPLYSQEQHEQYIKIGD